MYGLPEPKLPSNGEKKTQIEDSEKKVKDMITNILKFDIDDINFDKLIGHIGSEAALQKPRPMVVEFHSYSDRERVNKSKLKRTERRSECKSPKKYRDARKIRLENAVDETK